MVFLSLTAFFLEPYLVSTICEMVLLQCCNFRTDHFAFQSLGNILFLLRSTLLFISLCFHAPFLDYFGGVGTTLVARWNYLDSFFACRLNWWGLLGKPRASLPSLYLASNEPNNLMLVFKQWNSIRYIWIVNLWRWKMVFHFISLVPLYLQ